MLTGALDVTGGAREALIPRGFRTSLFRGRGSQARSSHAANGQAPQLRAGYLEPHLAGQPLRVGPRRTTVALQATNSPEENQLPRMNMTAATFDASLRGVLEEARESSMDAAVDSWLDRLDENFIPDLADRIKIADDSELPELQNLMTVLGDRSLMRYERARDQLQTLIGAGEINVMDDQIVKMVKADQIDAGFFYVLQRNIDDCRKSGGLDATERLLSHIQTRLQEELEKRLDPASAIVHKLWRLDEGSIRKNVLRDSLVPKSTITLPGGEEMPLDKPAPASIQPLEFAAAIEYIVARVVSLNVEPEATKATVEDLRQVAKEARQVLTETYDPETVNAFSDALQPVFSPYMNAGKVADTEESQ